MNIKEIVKGTEAEFVEYRDGNLHYLVKYDHGTDISDGTISADWKEFSFPIPIEDTKGAVFPAKIKAITLMRWIRKHVSLIQSGAEVEA